MSPTPSPTVCPSVFSLGSSFLPPLLCLLSHDCAFLDFPPSCCDQEEPTYFAIWGDNKAFNEVIISPAMLHEHLPYVVMEGLNKVIMGIIWGGTRGDRRRNKKFVLNI